MAEFRLTQPAKADVEALFEYTLKIRGARQGERYLRDLQTCLQELALQPHLGRRCDEIRPGLMRMEQGRHVLFYRKKDYGIRIIRILHQRMLPDNHLWDDQE